VDGPLIAICPPPGGVISPTSNEVHSYATDIPIDIALQQQGFNDDVVLLKAVL
jgi:hypothetical protein